MALRALLLAGRSRASQGIGRVWSGQARSLATSAAWADGNAQQRASADAAAAAAAADNDDDAAFGCGPCSSSSSSSRRHDDEAEAFRERLVDAVRAVLEGGMLSSGVAAAAASAQLKTMLTPQRPFPPGAAI